ncbi:MAG: transglycosylase domain-containing protein, partial [candidate division Zixibacteria bacterium]|nr:transglycosylase domain-containing protein [candidate division Zixibacteria bacterium]
MPLSGTNMSAEQRARQARLLTLFGLLLMIFAAYLLVQAYHIYQSDLPSFEALHNIEPNLSTKLYDRNGILLKEFYTENRALTPLADIPPAMVQMLIASEDREFYEHWGINVRRTLTVAVTNILHWRLEAGASTLTQQLARMLFLSPRKTLERKAKEALTAIKLERTYSKDEILEMYLNQHYFSKGAYGVSAAARMFFNKRVPELNYNDCAVIIGLLKAPNVNSPLNSPEKSLQARNRVLYSYFEVGGLTQQQFDSLRAAPLEIAPPEEKEGIGPYFTETIRQYLIQKYGDTLLYSGGLQVRTTLDAHLQKVAEKSLHERIDSLRAKVGRNMSLSNPQYTEVLSDTVDALGDSIRVFKKVQGAFLALDNATGDVIAMDGGRSFDNTKFNRAVQAMRQPGSAFKPFVYTACIENGFKTSDIVDDNPIVLDIPGSKQWRPHNFDDKFMGPIPVRTALAQSRNLAAIRSLLKLGAQEAIYYAKRMGITSPLSPVPSLAIGTSEIRMTEIVPAFMVFPNKGIRVNPRMILKIIDRYGRVLEDNSAIKREEVLAPQTAFIMTDMMRSVVDEGTGIRARAMG